MSEQLKFIVQELNKEPFNKSFNLISFDSLEPLQLLQVLNDVLGVVDPKQAIDIREETPDMTAIRVFGCLRVLKYKPPTESTFRTGLVQGEKPVVYHIMEWMLRNIPMLKKRAYLAKFLVKVDVPGDIMQEDPMNDLYAQYEELIETFKELHKQAENLRTGGYNTGEIRKDISNMEDEKEQLIKRVDRLKRKVEQHPNANTMMNVAKNLRLERDKEKKLAEQRQEQLTLIQHSEQRIKRLQQQLHDQRQAAVGATPEGLLQRLEEETRANSYIVKERLPKDIESKKKTVSDLQRVVAEPAMGQADLEELHKKISDLNTEINQLVEKRMRSGEPMDDKLSLFRQQAAIIAHKKENAAEGLREARDEYSRLMHEVDEKRDLAKQASGGGEVLKGEEFKRYVNKLRSKSTIYKKKRQELAELKAEYGVLARTEEILHQRDENIDQQLSVLESKAGVAGYRATQENLEKVSSKKSHLDHKKGQTLEEIADMVKVFTQRIAEKKGALAPIIKELRPLRQQAQELTVEYNDKKKAYDTKAAGLESNMAKLEAEVRGLHEELTQEESRYHYLHCMMGLLHQQEKRVHEEMKSYTSQDMSARKRNFREQYVRKIQEQENLAKGLREQQKGVREGQQGALQQMKMWRDLERLIECKRACLERQAGFGGGQAGYSYMEQPPAVLEDDRLVL
ncbi:intraflagellar transport protein 81 homolog isoform X2 [Dreissena polymorpha]|uniref:intraflagellar transport protein 81 homolog isoform X2 n=1 Tax=Dreissena polymorpha TaxID=45954 RepID=UPI002264C233|nr:intraflagellar transport protein 81 homolog isoform X2 [Dreissena polymorpha]